MDRAVLLGLGLAATGAIALLSAELIATAQAGRPGEREYLVAVSSGTQLRLMQRLPTPAATSHIVTGSVDGSVPIRQLACRTVIDTASVSFGYRCR